MTAIEDEELRRPRIGQPAFEEPRGRGFLLLSLGEYERALTDLDRALRLQLLDAAGSYCGRGVAYLGLGHPERALQDFDRALELSPDDDLAHLHRALAYFDLGQRERALQDFHKAVQLQRKSAATGREQGSERAVLEEILPDHFKPGECSGRSPKNGRLIEAQAE